MESARLPCCTTFSRLSFSMPRQFVDFFADLAVERDRLEHVVQFVGQFRRQRGEIVDEIERVLDLVRDAGGELAERGELLGLDQAILRGTQVVERAATVPSCAAWTCSNIRTLPMAITAWSAKVCSSSICLSLNGLDSRCGGARSRRSLSPSRNNGTRKDRAMALSARHFLASGNHRLRPKDRSCTCTDVLSTRAPRGPVTVDRSIVAG